MKRFFLAFTFLALGPHAGAVKAAPADLVQWMDEGEALESSKKTGKPLLYFFTAAWSAPGKRMAAEVFGNSETAAWINQNFLALRIQDQLRERGINPIRTNFLQNKYDIQDFPSLVVEVPAKRIFHKWKRDGGYRNPRLTREFLENALLDLKESK